VFRLIGRKEKKLQGLSAKTPITDVRYVVVDTELTGLDEKTDAIISIGAVRMTGGRIDLGDTFYRLVGPRVELRAANVLIHEIMPSDLAVQPAIDTVLAKFLDYAGNDVLVGHFISIDLAFFNREMKRLYGREIGNPVIDTFTLDEWLRKRLKSHDCFAKTLSGYRLYDIAKSLDVPVNGSHNAIVDAFTTAQLMQRFIPLLIEAGVHDIGELLKRGKPFEGGDRFRITGDFGNF
jgi:DNA polymerase III subunit epsilon